MENPNNKAKELIDRLMFATSLTHLDEVKQVAKIFIEEIKFNCLDDATKFWNKVDKEIDKL